MKIRSLVACSVLSCSLLAGCNGEMKASAEEIVTNVLASDEKTNRYYAESMMKIYEHDQLTNTITMQEYVSSEKRKVITIDHEANQQSIAFNTGKQLISYDVVRNEAFSIDISEEDGLPLNSSPKDQVMQMIESLKETHTYEIVGEETVAGFDTFHLKFTPKKKSAIFGEMNVWVEQKNWFPVKNISVNGENRIEIEYSKVDYKPKFDENTFAVVLPDDVKIKKLEDTYAPKSGTIKEAEEALGQSFLMLENKEIESTIELDEIKGEINRTEVTVNYSKDEIPYFAISIFHVPEETDTELDMDGEKVTVRGQTGEYLEGLGLMWDEDGLRYNLIMTNPNIELEEVLELIEKMERSS